MRAAAMDYGASSGRCMLAEYDGERLTLKEMHRFTNAPMTKQGELYWDTPWLYQQLIDGLTKCRAQGQVDSIAIDTWGVDFALLDSEGGLAGTPFCYRSPHTDGIPEEAFAIMPKREIYRRTGIQIMKINTLYQLMAIQKYRPELLDKARHFLTIPDLLAYWLSGEKGCEYSMATTTQMLDPFTKMWDRELILAMGLPERIFGAMRQPGTVLGQTHLSLFNRQIPVITAAQHDTASAIFAIPYESEGAMFISSGTWSLAGVETDEPVINDRAYELELTNEGGYGGRTTLLQNITGLWILQQLKAEWEQEGKRLSWDDIIQAAKESKPFTCFIDANDDSFIFPGPMAGRIAQYCIRTGQDAPHGLGETARAVMESLALKYRQVHEGLTDVTGKKIGTIQIIGGGCQNTLLNQFTANATGATVVAGPVEATAMGNALAQFIALGEIAGIDEAKDVIKRSYTCTYYIPRDRALWDEAYGKLEMMSRG